VTAALGGSPTAVTVTTGSRHSGDATWPVARPRAAAKRCGGVELELADGNGENGREVTRGVLFMRAGFLACATRSPLQFYLQFEACLFFSLDLRKISRVGDKLIASVRTPYEFGDRALGGGCETEYGVVKGCGAGTVRHGTRMELSVAEGDWRHTESSGRGTGLAALIQRGARPGGLRRGKWRREKLGRVQENWPNW
jgi:hypothetical protein